MRQAFAGMLWSKQLFYYDVARWLDGDPTPADAARRRGSTGRNSRWRNFDAFDIMSMPDKWEYPWFAAWDLAFHCVALAHVDPAFAKYQLILICREWFQHPNGALPAYEWSFDDVNPPVQAWAALEVFAIDGGDDVDFLRRVFDKLLVNFTWWVNREDADGSNLFEGGFLGLDNIGPIDRDHLPVAGTLEQSDATAWMALYSLHMATMASVLRAARPADAGPDAQVPRALRADPRARSTTRACGTRTDGFFYDRIELADGDARARSRCGRWSACCRCWPASSIDEVLIERAETLGKGFADLLGATGLRPRRHGRARAGPRRARRAAAAASAWSASTRSSRLFDRLFDEDEFLSPYGHAGRLAGAPRPSVRARDRRSPREHRLRAGRVDHRTCSAATPTGAGPIWFPLNYLLVSSIKRLRQLLRRLVHRRVPDRLGRAAHARRDRRGPAAPADLDLPRRRRRPPAVLRRGRQAPGRPALAGLRAVQRVLPRRQRRRPRRVAPDRLDRPRRRPDPPGPRSDAHQPRCADPRCQPERDVAAARPHDRAARDAPFPLGATPTADGTNFAVASDVADGHDPVPVRRRRHRAPRPDDRLRRRACGTRSSPASGPAQRYGFRATGPWDPARGLRCNETKLLLDPYARAITGEVRFGPEVLGHAEDDPEQPSPLDSAGSVPRSVVVDPTFDWGDDAPPRRSYADTIFYELHLKGFTQLHPDVPARAAGHLRRPRPPRGDRAPRRPRRHRGRAAARAPLRARGVPRRARGCTNYWGYNTIGYFAPARGVLGRGPRRPPRRPGRRVQDDGAARCTPPGWRSSSTSSSTTPPRPDPTARRCATAASTTRRTTGSSPPTRGATSTRPAAATRSTSATRPRCV